MNVEVKIGAIILGCDESINNIMIGRDYNIIEREEEALFFHDEVIDGNGRLSSDYYTSRIVRYGEQGESTSFMCLEKEDSFEVADVDSQLDLYKENEFQYLNTIFSLLQIFKMGSIGLRSIFFVFKYNTLGFINNTRKMKITIQDANVLNRQTFKIASEEKIECNEFISKYQGRVYEIMGPIINRFTYGLKQIEQSTGFEQLTTALEMIFLPADTKKGKKEMLSKRVAVLLGQNNEEIKRFYESMKRYYRFRSESLHEGNGQNITEVEFKELADIARNVLRRYLDICVRALKANSSIAWDEIKKAEVTLLISKVTELIQQEVLPK